MQKNRGGMGNTKHGKSGKPTKSPRMRFLEKLEAEKNIRIDNSRIKNPKSTIKELFGD